jgi:hypothetical protein
MFFILYRSLSFRTHKYVSDFLFNLGILHVVINLNQQEINMN